MENNDCQFGNTFAAQQARRLAIGQLKKEAREASSDQIGDKLTQLVAYAEDASIRDDALLAILKLSQTGKLLPDTLAAHEHAMLAWLSEVLQKLQPLQRSPSQLEWMLDEDYTPLRHTGGILLDLLGYLPLDRVEPFIQEGLALHDPRLKMIAALSLLRNGRVIAESDLDAIGASHEVRLLCWEQLRKLGMESLMPIRWASPEMLAASDLSLWASFPSELGVPPEEVECMAKFPVAVEGRRGDVCLFRFREFPKPWEPDDGWKAGVAGPCVDGKMLRSPWSKFESWNSRSPEAHYAALMIH